MKNNLRVGSNTDYGKILQIAAYSVRIQRGLNFPEKFQWLPWRFKIVHEYMLGLALSSCLSPQIILATPVTFCLAPK